MSKFSNLFNLIQGWIKVKGNDDGTFIGNEGKGSSDNVFQPIINDRLKVKTAEEDIIKEILQSWRINHEELIEELRRTQEIIFTSSLQMKDIKIKSANGSSDFANVNKFQALKVNNQSLPDRNDPITQVALSGFFENNGITDARVDGSATPVDFAVSSRDDGDIYINAISFKIADANASLNNFGSIGSLANGFQLIYFNNELGELVLADNLVSNFEIIRLCQGLPAFSQGTESFRASNVVANSEGYLPVLQMQNFGLPFGIRIRANSEDRLLLRIRDDVTGVDAFDIFYYANRLI